ncbi:Fc.00g106600.m01.CDS01 [Cosmosporella sp. VM-42]
MEKCWFVLPQTHYPPPQEDGDRQSGPLCLGHFIQDLRHLDQVINSSPEPFPLDMPIYRTPPVEFAWERNKERGFEVNAQGQVQIAAAPVTAKASFGTSLKKTVQEYWQIQQLETMILQPSRTYISRSLASVPVAEFLKQKRGLNWSVFVITGLKIARGNSSSKKVHGNERSFDGGPGVGIAGVAEASLEGKVSSATSVSVETQYSNDFIWAVRLSKITKGLFDKTWSQKTFSKGATFDMTVRKDLQDVENILREEGLPSTEILSLDSDDDSEEIIIIGANDG